MCAKGGPVFRVVCKCREIVGTDMSVMGLFAPSVLVHLCQKFAIVLMVALLTLSLPETQHTGTSEMCPLRLLVVIQRRCECLCTRMHVCACARAHTCMHILS